jgi:hypothetical protein
MGPHQNIADAILPLLPWVIGGAVLVTLSVIAGWMFTTWLRVRNGYPLETRWGKAIEPRVTTETAERFKLIAVENAQLRAELGSVKDRLATVERIVTDDSHRLTQDIEALRMPRN